MQNLKKSSYDGVGLAENWKRLGHSQTAVIDCVVHYDRRAFTCSGKVVHIDQHFKNDDDAEEDSRFAHDLGIVVVELESDNFGND